MRTVSKGKFKNNIRKRLAGTPVSFEELVSGAGGVTGLSSHIQSMRVGAWPSLHPPVAFIGSTINTTYTNSIDVSGIGLSVGDTLIVCCGYDSSSTFSATGYTSLFNGSAGGMNIAIFSQKITGAVPSSVNISGNANTIIAAGFGGVNTVSAETVVTTSSNLSTITPRSTSFANGGGVVVFAAQDDTVTATATAPDGYTIARQGGVANGTQRATGALMYKTGLTSGAESPAAVTWSETDTLAAFTLRLDCIV